jgi:hypothetical protein
MTALRCRRPSSQIPAVTPPPGRCFPFPVIIIAMLIIQKNFDYRKCGKLAYVRQSVNRLVVFFSVDPELFLDMPDQIFFTHFFRVSAWIRITPKI